MAAIYHNVRDKYGRFAPAKTTKAKRTKAKKVDTNKVILSAFLLDASASMAPKVTGTVSGFNELLQQARKDAEKTGVKSVELLAMFGARGRYISTNNVREVRLGTNCSVSENGDVIRYAADLGDTALWESAGQMLKETESLLRMLPKNTKVIFTIFTDGEENASSIDWKDGTKLKELIAQKQKEGWVVNFIGAGSDFQVKQVARSVGIVASNTLSYTNNTAGNAQAFATMSSSRSSYAKAVADGVESNVGFFAD